MAQTNNTTLQLYYSPTAAAVPTAGNLAFGELAINILDEKLYFKNSSGVVKLLASPTGATGTVQSVSVVSANGLAGTVATDTTTPAITLSTTVTGILKGNGTAISAAVASTDYAPATSGTSILKGNGTGGFANAVASTDYAPATSGSNILYGNGTGGFSGVTVAAPLTFAGGILGLGPVTAGAAILYGDGAGGISNVTIGTGVSFSGGVLSATGTGGTVTSVTGTSPVVSSGGATPAISLATNYGDTQNPYDSKTANFVLAAPNGSAGAPTFRALLAADIPTLNQNTTGTAANVTGTVAIANGGSGQTTAQAGMNAFAGAVTSGQYLRGNGTNVVMSTIQAADVPTLNQTTTGNAGGLATTNWTVFQSGTKLFFAYNGVNKASIDSNGNIITVGNVTAFGTP
jgi:hypothetical protein